MWSYIVSISFRGPDAKDDWIAMSVKGVSGGAGDGNATNHDVIRAASLLPSPSKSHSLSFSFACTAVSKGG
jgi:hypothetical protein